MRPSVFLALGLFNLAVVASSAGLYEFLPASPKAWSESRLLPPLQVYQGISGVFTSYGFFAPEIPSLIRLRFFITHRDGSQTEVDLSGADHETAIRFGDVQDTLRQFNSNHDVRRALFASLTGKVFAKHRDAERIEAVLEIFDPPRMGGAQPSSERRWIRAYSAVFNQVQKSS